MDSYVIVLLQIRFLAWTISLSWKDCEMKNIQQVAVVVVVFWLAWLMKVREVLGLIPTTSKLFYDHRLI